MTTLIKPVWLKWLQIRKYAQYTNENTLHFTSIAIHIYAWMNEHVFVDKQMYVSAIKAGRVESTLLISGSWTQACRFFIRINLPEGINAVIFINLLTTVTYPWLVIANNMKKCLQYASDLLEKSWRKYFLDNTCILIPVPVPNLQPHTNVQLYYVCRQRVNTHVVHRTQSIFSEVNFERMYSEYYY